MFRDEETGHFPDTEGNGKGEQKELERAERHAGWLMVSQGLQCIS